ncbi:hypothetical protein [Botrimarina mediterranea]|uniref:SpoVT-AbrB domain-containing protein n=1 Tax=Botrimarina mediterranea TaxID=2528022 RepID=A0A518K2V2_9BACT|nr:hypothetical protein [Botrimarina mediterranea]QDV72138.1 hypothetical protein Spa11_03100 [Botrimarina mediterranea]QDV76680.1 hypothetical protein K2D_02610 [Planctomycetes bacterium K2D]
MTTKTLDSKGRLTLGPQYAGQLVIIDDSDSSQIVIRRAVALPVEEAWLFQNEKAQKLVAAGLRDAKAGEFVEGPDLDADLSAFDDE